uniref:Uncharacterized protein n=1 Tax=Chrysodeixis chalcites nucleopolyhedrovirus TaxID=320432 RepID=T1R074_9ABAC|nr:hypothetical protein [Chrysodeixis chalcites nucleopolyhedrovirus]
MMMYYIKQDIEHLMSVLLKEKPKREMVLNERNSEKSYLLSRIPKPTLLKDNKVFNLVADIFHESKEELNHKGAEIVYTSSASVPSVSEANSDSDSDSDDDDDTLEKFVKIKKNVNAVFSRTVKQLKKQNKLIKKFYSAMNNVGEGESEETRRLNNRRMIAYKNNGLSIANVGDIVDNLFRAYVEMTSGIVHLINNINEFVIDRPYSDFFDGKKPYSDFFDGQENLPDENNSNHQEDQAGDLTDPEDSNQEEDSNRQEDSNNRQEDSNNRQEDSNNRQEDSNNRQEDSNNYQKNQAENLTDPEDSNYQEDIENQAESSGFVPRDSIFYNMYGDQDDDNESVAYDDIADVNEVNNISENDVSEINISKMNMQDEHQEDIEEDQQEKDKNQQDKKENQQDKDKDQQQETKRAYQEWAFNDYQTSSHRSDSISSSNDDSGSVDNTTAKRNSKFVFKTSSRARRDIRRDNTVRQALKF